MRSPFHPLSFPTYRAMFSFGKICPTRLAKKSATNIMGMIFKDIRVPDFPASINMDGSFLYANPAAMAVRMHMVIKACTIDFSKHGCISMLLIIELGLK